MSAATRETERCTNCAETHFMDALHALNDGSGDLLCKACRAADDERVLRALVNRDIAFERECERGEWGSGEWG